MRVAMEAGFSRALATITDANVSVVITAGILTILGSGPVKALLSQLRRRCYCNHVCDYGGVISCCAYLLTVTLQTIHSGLVRISLKRSAMHLQNL